MQRLQCTATPPGGGGVGQWNSCNARAHQLGGHGGLPRRRSLRKERNSCKALPHCLGQWALRLSNALQSLRKERKSCKALPHCLGQWAVQLLQCTATPPVGVVQCNSCNMLPQCLGAMGTAPPAINGLTAWGHWGVELPQCTASLLRGSGHCNSRNTLSHRLGALGIVSPSMRGPTS